MWSQNMEITTKKIGDWLMQIPRISEFNLTCDKLICVWKIETKWWLCLQTNPGNESAGGRYIIISSIVMNMYISCSNNKIRLLIITYMFLITAGNIRSIYGTVNPIEQYDYQISILYSVTYP